MLSTYVTMHAPSITTAIAAAPVSGTDMELAIEWAGSGLQGHTAAWGDQVERELG